MSPCSEVFSRSIFKSSSRLSRAARVACVLVAGAAVSRASAQTEVAVSERAVASEGSSFAGTYRGPNAKLELAGPAEEMTGTLTIEGTKYPVTCRSGDGELRGTILVGETSYTFRASLAGGVLTLESDGISTTLTREATGSANPLARASAKVGVPSHLTQTLEHAQGFAMNYATGWKVQEFNGSKALVPEDAKKLLGEPAEVYALVAIPWKDGAPGAESGTGAIAERLMKEVRETFPLLTREGGVETLGSGESSAMLMRFAAPRLGELDAGAHVRAAVRDGLLIVLFGIGERSELVKRDAAANEMFLTLRRIESKRDPAIVGSWSHSDSYSSSGFSAATSRRCVINGDGTYSYETRIVGGTADVGMDSGADAVSGTWSAEGSVLTLTSSAGDITRVTYKLVDGSLVVTYGDGSRRIWQR